MLQKLPCGYRKVLAIPGVFEEVTGLHWTSWKRVFVAIISRCPLEIHQCREDGPPIQLQMRTFGTSSVQLRETMQINKTYFEAFHYKAWANAEMLLYGERQLHRLSLADKTFFLRILGSPRFQCKK